MNLFIIGQVISALFEYKSDLLSDSLGAAEIGESSVDSDLRAKNIEKIEAALEVLKDDFIYRIFNA